MYISERNAEAGQKSHAIDDHTQSHPDGRTVLQRLEEFLIAARCDHKISVYCLQGSKPVTLLMM